MDDFILQLADINFYTSPEKLMQNGFYIKSFITGKVTISYDADDGRSAFGDKKINFICAIYEDENISCDY